MADYIMRKLGEGMLGDHEKQYPKLISTGEVGLDELAETIQSATTFTRADIAGLLAALSDAVARAAAQGMTVRLPGLGLITPVLGLVDKDKRKAWTTEGDRIATTRNVRLKALNFRADRSLLHKVDQGMKLTRVGGLGQDSAMSTTLEERAEAARQYLVKYGFMHVSDYMELTHQSRTRAAKELRALAEDADSGIITRGRGPAKVYLLKELYGEQ